MSKKNLAMIFGIFFLLFSAIAVAYRPAINSGYILDDYVWIQPLTGRQIGRLFIGSWEHLTALRPVMRLQFLSDRLMFGENPLGWHITNLILHALISLSAFLILRARTNKTALAFFGALLFALFPTNHEVVAWISGRTHAVGLLLSLGAGYLLYRSATAEKQKTALLISGLTLLLAAFLTYEISFVAPMALLSAVLIIGPQSRRAWLTAWGSVALLIALVLYRIIVLGGTLGTVGRKHENILLAPFLNVPGIKTLYLYSTELKILALLLVIIFAYAVVRQRLWRERDRTVRAIILCLLFSIISYLPFSVIKGVAPRFLYASLLLCILGFCLLYARLAPKLNPLLQKAIVCLAALLLVASAGRTWQVAVRYKEVGDAYQRVAQTVVADFPAWPPGKDMLFYKIPNSHWNVAAFLTYFDRVIKRNYPNQPSGEVYRAEQLSTAALAEVLRQDPIIYEFVNMRTGVKRKETTH